MAAMAGATGARSWLQARHRTWLTPRRIRLATAIIFVGEPVSGRKIAGAAAVLVGVGLTRVRMLNPPE